MSNEHPSPEELRYLVIGAYRVPMRYNSQLGRYLPDTSDPVFRAEARRQAALIAASPQEAEDQAFIDSVSVLLNGDGV